MVKFDGRDFGRSEATLHKERGIGRVVHDVNVLVAQFAHNAMDTAAFHANAGTDRINALVVAFYRDFGAFSGKAYDVFDLNYTVFDFGHFGFEQFSQEIRVGAAEHDKRHVVAHFHALDDAFYYVAFAVIIAANHFGAGEYNFVAGIVVEYQDLFFHDLVHFARDDLTNPLGVFAENLVFFELHYP